MSEQAGFLGMLLDCLEDQIAVLDASGQIIYVNHSWVRFGIDNGQPHDFVWVGTNYLKACHASAICGDADARTAYEGIHRVLGGEADNFHHEYPCHSPTQQRWFLMRLVPLRSQAEPYFVISHVDITQRKLVEEQVEALSLIDQLTGLANRRHFDRFLHDEWHRNMREQTPISLIMFDLDHFKTYNDTRGHQAGDELLRRVGAILGHHARRPTDLAARYGGEEFVLVLGNTDLGGAAITAESARASIAGLGTDLASGDCTTSASAGVTCTIPPYGGLEGKLVELADHALYRAKQSGRNQVVKSDCSLAPSERSAACRDRPCNPGTYM